MPGVGTFISVGKSLEQAVERVKRAEALGYDSSYVTHIAGRDSLTVLMAYAAGTDRIKLGTGVLPIYSRTPVATAQSAATIDEYSRGRMVLGLGVSHQVTVENWYGTRLERPLKAMREYLEIVRAAFRGVDRPEGEIFKSRFRFMGYEPRPDLPIYVAGLSPRMLRLAGERAGGESSAMQQPGPPRPASARSPGRTSRPRWKPQNPPEQPKTWLPRRSGRVAV